MSKRALSHSLAMPGCFLALLLVPSMGCSPSTEPGRAEALQQMFPEQSSAVLEGRATILETSSGYHLAASPRVDDLALVGGLPRRGLQVTWPARGEDAVRFELPDGLALEVREGGLAGAPELEGETLAYARADGASYWSADENGFEEWLRLDEGLAYAGRTVASFTASGMALRQRGDVVEVVDGAGEVRLEVSAPAAYADGGVLVPARLDARGDRLDLSVDAAGARVLVDPKWTPTGTMATPRYTHAAERLGSGKVLVMAGYNASGFVGSAELYEPSTKLWSPAGALTTPRHYPNAEHLADDRVIVIGGLTDAGYLSDTEIYDPPSNGWTGGPPMSTARYASATAATTGGRLVVSGGVSDYDAYLGTSEIYDPATNGWSPGGALVEARWLHTATALGDGRIVIAGGENATGTLASGEIYNPLTNAWSPTGPLTTARRGHRAVLLGNGRILVVGGEDGTYASIASAELYDPPTNAWIPAPPMLVPRYLAEATLLADGTVLVSGGRTTVSYVSSTEIYDPVTNAFTLGAYMTDERYFHTATLLQNQRVLVTGGFDGALVQPTAELYH